MKRLFESTALAVRLEVILGAIFIYASLHKIADPPDFAHQICNYKLVLGELVNLAAIYLPWIELVTGAALIAGCWGRRGAAALVGAMLIVFIIAISYNLARGHPVDCGCFEGSGGLTKTREQRFDEMRWTIIRDVGMLLMVVQILFARRAKPAEGEGARAA